MGSSASVQPRHHRRGRSTLPALPALVLSLILALAIGPAAAQEEAGDGSGETAPGLAIVADDERPLRGQVVRLTVTEGGRPAAGARVSAVYRPNSETQHESELAAVDSSGTVLWTPEYTGPVTLEVRPAGTPSGPEPPAAAALTVAVRYGGLPASGLFIMILAGVLLFGGAIVSMVLLLRPPDHLPPTEPPST